MNLNEIISMDWIRYRHYRRPSLRDQRDLATVLVRERAKPRRNSTRTRKRRSAARIEDRPAFRRSATIARRPSPEGARAAIPCRTTRTWRSRTSAAVRTISRCSEGIPIRIPLSFPADDPPSNHPVYYDFFSIFLFF